MEDEDDSQHDHTDWNVLTKKPIVLESNQPNLITVVPAYAFGRGPTEFELIRRHS